MTFVLLVFREKRSDYDFCGICGICVTHDARRLHGGFTDVGQWLHGRCAIDVRKRIYG